MVDRHGGGSHGSAWPVGFETRLLPGVRLADEQLLMLVEAVTGAASARCRGVFRFLAASNPIGTVDYVADALRFSNRHQLSRHLQGHGFPPFHKACDWLNLLRWLLVSEQNGLALATQAWASGAEPSVFYRTVSRVTGGGWVSARSRHLSDWLDEFRAEASPSRRCLSRREMDGGEADTRIA